MTSENKNEIYQNLWDAEEARLREKFISLSACKQKRRKSRTNDLSFCLKPRKKSKINLKD